MSSTIQSMDLPIISKKGLHRLLSSLIRRDFNNTSTLYDMGYEQAKKDIAVILEGELNISFDNNSARNMIRALQ